MVNYIFDEKQCTSLCEIMGNNGCDNSHHSIFKDMRDKPLRLFELGNETSGSSLQGWSEYFYNSKIYGAGV